MTAADGPFLMWVGDVFRPAPGAAVWATGLVERGRVRAGDTVEVVGFGADARAVAAQIEVRRAHAEEAGPGSNAGLLLRGAAAATVEPGQVVAAPGSVRAYAAFSADVVVLAEEEGGADVFPGDRLRFHFATAAVPGIVTLPEGTDVLRPLHRGRFTVVLDRPVPVEEGRRFAFRHHGRAAGSGTVTGVAR
ncbi:EF-Tu/IF-2/RF-3 family GTPase [Streptomyces sp. NPDC014995]|uniref:EF-Tu C-terminal domain-related protein n=1 Tax=Streptomyces sp. NPDC014995 TaxID=3364936 RepID=UPI0036FC2FE2